MECQYVPAFIFANTYATFGFRVELVVPDRVDETAGLTAGAPVELLTAGFGVVVVVEALTGAAEGLAPLGLVVPSLVAVVREANGLVVDEFNELREAPPVAEDDPCARLERLLIIPATRLAIPFAATGFFSLPEAS